MVFSPGNRNPVSISKHNWPIFSEGLWGNKSIKSPWDQKRMFLIGYKLSRYRALKKRCKRVRIFETSSCFSCVFLKFLLHALLTSPALKTRTFNFYHFHAKIDGVFLHIWNYCASYKCTVYFYKKENTFFVFLSNKTSLSRTEELQHLTLV